MVITTSHFPSRPEVTNDVRFLCVAAGGGCNNRDFSAGGASDDDCVPDSRAAWSCDPGKNDANWIRIENHESVDQ